MSGAARAETLSGAWSIGSGAHGAAILRGRGVP
jgi:hypothetical protein